MLDQITPALLTYNEAPNIGRSLARLGWARDIVLVDSHSTDETLEIAARFPNVRTFKRRFDCHRDQWRYAIEETGIETEWALRLDADYLLTAALVEEMRALRPADDVAGYSVPFIYCIYGRPLRASMYPPRVRLFRPARVDIRQDGHTEAIVPRGRTLALSRAICHDDRKPLSRWVAEQDRYAGLEAAKLTDAAFGPLGLPDRIRRRKYLAPFAVLVYCLLGKGLILDGMPGLYYCFQRATAEFLLSLHLMDRELSARPAEPPA